MSNPVPIPVPIPFTFVGVVIPSSVVVGGGTIGSGVESFEAISAEGGVEDVSSSAGEVGVENTGIGRGTTCGSLASSSFFGVPSSPNSSSSSLASLTTLCASVSPSPCPPHASVPLVPTVRRLAVFSLLTAALHVLLLPRLSSLACRLGASARTLASSSASIRRAPRRDPAPFVRREGETEGAKEEEASVSMLALSGGGEAG